MKKTAVRGSCLILLLACGAGTIAWGTPAEQEAPASAAGQSTTQPAQNHSGDARTGEASYYGESFYGKTMADGTPMDPDSNIAASRSLPLGTTARVTNLENGKSAIVEIRDRGPYIDGRILDVSPRVARKLGMMEDGVVTVEVRPIDVPQAAGSKAEGSQAVASDNAVP